MARRITKLLLPALAALMLLVPGAASGETLKTHSVEHFGDLHFWATAQRGTYRWTLIEYRLRSCRPGHPDAGAICSWTLIGIESEGAGCQPEYNPASRPTFDYRKFFDVTARSSFYLQGHGGSMFAHPGPDGNDELCWYLRFEHEKTGALVATTTIRP